MNCQAEFRSLALYRLSTALLSIPPVKLNDGVLPVGFSTEPGMMATVYSESIINCQVLAVALSVVYFTLLLAVVV